MHTDAELLAKAVAKDEARRAARWQLRFRLGWAALLGLLAAFVFLSLNVEVDFLTRATPFILEGIWITLAVSSASIVLATLLAALGALGRLSSNAVVNAIASFYVSFFRGTPLILQLLVWYLALPQVGIILDPIFCAIGALGMNYGAYMTEIFRAGIQAVPLGQREAAAALGMSGGTAFRRIIAPQAFRIIVPAIGNDFVAMLKDSALASTVALHEIVWRARPPLQQRSRQRHRIVLRQLLPWHAAHLAAACVVPGPAAGRHHS